MLKLLPKLMLVVGIGLTGAACVDDGNAGPSGYYQPTAAYGNPYQNSGYYSPAPAPAYRYAPAYGYAQPAPGYGYANVYANQQRYTTVTVTNRGQNGYRDDVVQQQVACGSQYYDGYRTRTAPRC